MTSRFIDIRNRIFAFDLDCVEPDEMTDSQRLRSTAHSRCRCAGTPGWIALIADRKDGNRARARDRARVRGAIRGIEAREIIKRHGNSKHSRVPNQRARVRAAAGWDFALHSSGLFGGFSELTHSGARGVLREDESRFGHRKFRSMRFRRSIIMIK